MWRPNESTLRQRAYTRLIDALKKAVLLIVHISPEGKAGTHLHFLHGLRGDLRATRLGYFVTLAMKTAKGCMVRPSEAAVTGAWALVSSRESFGAEKPAGARLN